MFDVWTLYNKIMEPRPESPRAYRQTQEAADTEQHEFDETLGAYVLALVQCDLAMAQRKRLEVYDSQIGRRIGGRRLDAEILEFLGTYDALCRATCLGDEAAVAFLRTKLWGSRIGRNMHDRHLYGDQYREHGSITE